MRRSGRTTRMLEAAAKVAMSGPRVTIIMWTIPETKDVGLQLRGILEKLGDRHAVMEAIERIRIIAAKGNYMVRLDADPAIRGWSAGEIFVYHAAVEAHIGQRLLGMMHAWDKPSVPDAPKGGETK